MKKTLLLSLLLALSTGLDAQAQELSSFESDGCSMYPNGTLDEPQKWLHCCFVHDIAYWKGGTKEQREVSDDVFRQCVANETSDEHAIAIKIGVRIGGAPYSIWPWRWGFGHEKIRPYSPLNENEIMAIQSQYPTILDSLKKWSNDVELSEWQIQYIENAYYEDLNHSF